MPSWEMRWGCSPVDVTTVKFDAAREWVKPGDQVVDRGLTGPVRTGDAENLALFNREAQIIDGDQFAELLGDMVDFQDGIHTVVGIRCGCHHSFPSF